MNGRIVDHRAARRAALIATIWIPLAIVIASEAVVIVVGVSGKSQLIVHWGASGHRYGPWWSYAILVAAIGLPVIAFIGFFIARATQMAGMNAWMPAIAMGVTVFHALGMGVGSVVLNASPLAPALPLAGGALLAVAAALLTWWLLPRETPAATGVESADTLPVKPGEVAAWTGKVDLPAWFVSLIAAVAALLIALGVVSAVHRGLAPVADLHLPDRDAHASPRRRTIRRHRWTTRLPRPVGARLAATQDPRRRHRQSRSRDDRPDGRLRRLGHRWVIGPNHKGRWGIVTRHGTGLEVVRRNGRSIVVTVDDAGTAAAVLETYANK